jgi:alpha-glucosidase
MAESDWWRGGIVYEIYPRSFRDLNGDGIGDLKGITEKLGHVASLGVDAVWIAPFVKSPMKDFGYDVSDYRAVDPQFGTLNDFDALAKEAKRLGLKILVDYVISHTSDEHPWFIESRASRDNQKADWYVWADMKPDGAPPNNWLSVFGGSSWQWDTRRRQYYLHNFLTSQPDLNYHNPQVQDAALAEMRFWLERGVDGFRLDALNFAMHHPSLRDNPPAPDPSASEQPLTNPYAYQAHLYDKSQDALLPFLARIRALLNEFGATASLAEVGDDSARTLELMAGYAGSGDKIHMCYGFDFLSSEFSPAHFRKVIERFEREAGDAWPCWAFSNHDCIRHVSRWTTPGGDPAATARFAIGLILALRGSICLYQGEELGLTEADIKFEDLQDPAGIQFWPDYKGRDGCRTPIPWDASLPNAGFGVGQPWLPVEPAHLKSNAAAQDADAGSVLNFYRRAIAVRQSSAVLRTGSIEIVQASETMLVIRRKSGDEVITCVFNFSGAPAAVPAALAGNAILATGSSSDVLQPFGFVWLR